MKNDMRWWTAKESDVYSRLATTFDRLVQQDAERLEAALTFARMYGGVRQMGLGPTQYNRVDRNKALPDSRLRRNVIASCIDTGCAKLAKNRPAPQFVTNGADYATRRKAQKLTKFGKGLLHQCDAYRKAPTILRDAMIFGTGFVKVFRDEDRVGCERTFAWELFVDSLEAMYGEPRTLYQRRYVDRAVLEEKFAGGRGEESRLRAIRNAPTPADNRWPGRDTTSDQVEVIEAWRLPSCRDGDDGRHVIATRSGVLLDEPWDRPRFPFAILRWEDPIAGWWGRGMADRLLGLQLEINKLLQRIQLAMHLMGTTKVILDAGSGVPKSHVDNETGSIYVVAPGSQAPTVVPQQSVHPELIQQVDRLEMKAYEEVGISQLSATSRKPAGLDSGAALREYNDIESERFVVAGHRWEEFFLDVVRLGLDEVRGIPNFTVDCPDRKDPATYKWKDVDLEEEAYVLQCFPVSLLPSTPAGRIQMVQELAGAQWIDAGTAMEMLDLPDIEEMYDRLTASRKHVRKVIDRMLDGGEQEMPDGHLDLKTALEISQAAIWQAEDWGAPEDVVDKIRVFSDRCAELIAKATQGAAAPVAAAPMPPAAPMSPPMMAA